MIWRATALAPCASLALSTWAAANETSAIVWASTTLIESSSSRDGLSGFGSNGSITGANGSAGFAS